MYIKEPASKAIYFMLLIMSFWKVKTRKMVKHPEITKTLQEWAMNRQNTKRI